MAKRKHTGTVVIAILVAILLAVGVSGWLFWQSAQRVIGEAQQAGEYAAEAQQSVGQGDFKQALEQMCVCSIESGPCERVESLQMSGRF